MKAAIPPLPAFLKRTPGDRKPPAVSTGLSLGRELRAGQERARVKRLLDNQDRAKVRDAAASAFRELFPEIKDPARAKLTAEQDLIWARVQSDARTDLAINTRNSKD